MNLIKYILVIALVLFISGCGSTMMKPLYTQQPIIENTPNIEYLALREAPQSTSTNLHINFPKRSSEVAEENYILRNKKGLKFDSSIVISVPQEAVEAAKGEENRRRLEKSYQYSSLYAEDTKKSLEGMNKEDKENDFKTDGYYNEAEQLIEKALIRKGFNVLDRSKFEAKLRNLRDKSTNNAVEDRIRDELSRIRKQLEAQLEKGEITQQQFNSKWSTEQSRIYALDAGKRRLENEMIDISEVIRAAEEGDVSADYLLQINKVKVEPSYTRPLVIANQTEIKEHLSQNAGLRIGQYQGKEIPREIPTPWFRASFNAKMINVKTGSIVWLGDHLVESLDAEKDGINIDIHTSKHITNSEKINNAIKYHNARLKQLSDKVKSLKDSLNYAYSKAMSSKKFENKKQMNSYIHRLQNQISSLKTDLNNATQALVNKSMSKPAELNSDWQYSYSVSEPVVTPNLINMGQSKNLVDKERFEEHTNLMLKEVINKLIATIKIK